MTTPKFGTKAHHEAIKLAKCKPFSIAGNPKEWHPSGSFEDGQEYCIMDHQHFWIRAKYEQGMWISKLGHPVTPVMKDGEILVWKK